MASISRSEQFAAFLTDTKRYRNKREAESWFNQALQERPARTLAAWIETKGYPDIGFDSRDKYENWRKVADKSFSYFKE